jgi:hypothetical protein
MLIYQRVKNGAGKWRYVSIEEGQGKRTGGLKQGQYWPKYELRRVIQVSSNR